MYTLTFQQYNFTLTNKKKHFFLRNSKLLIRFHYVLLKLHFLIKHFFLLKNAFVKFERQFFCASKTRKYGIRKMNEGSSMQTYFYSFFFRRRILKTEAIDLYHDQYLWHECISFFSQLHGTYIFFPIFVVKYMNTMILKHEVQYKLAFFCLKFFSVLKKYCFMSSDYIFIMLYIWSILYQIQIHFH